MIIVAVVVVLIAKLRHLPKGDLYYLVIRSFVYSVFGGVISLVLLIAWIIYYERTTGFSAGNAPAAWILFYGPVSAAAGQLLALIIWWFKKPEPQMSP